MSYSDFLFLLGAVFIAPKLSNRQAMVFGVLCMVAAIVLSSLKTFGVIA